MDYGTLSQFGVAGLAVFLFYKLSANHMTHNTKMLGELRDVIRELKNYLERNEQKK